MRKPAFCICENKGADQLLGYHIADQGLCFRYIDGVIIKNSLYIYFLNLKFQASRHLLWNSTAQLCRTWSRTSEIGSRNTAKKTDRILSHGNCSSK